VCLNPFEKRDEKDFRIKRRCNYRTALGDLNYVPSSRYAIVTGRETGAEGRQYGTLRLLQASKILDPVKVQ